MRALERARAYEWAGATRELQNVVERAVILARGGTLSLPLPETVSVRAAGVAEPPAAVSTLHSDEIMTERQ